MCAVCCAFVSAPWLLIVHMRVSISRGSSTVCSRLVHNLCLRCVLDVRLATNEAPVVKSSAVQSASETLTCSSTKLCLGIWAGRCRCDRQSWNHRLSGFIRCHSCQKSGARSRRFLWRPFITVVLATRAPCCVVLDGVLTVLGSLCLGSHLVQMWFTTFHVHYR